METPATKVQSSFFILGSSFVFFLRSTLGIIVVAAYDDACEDKLESQVNTYVEYE